VSLVSVEQLARELSGARRPRLLDVRWPVPWPGGQVTTGPGPADRHGYEQAHLPGAAFVDLDTDLAGPVGDASRGRHPLPDPQAFTAAMREAGVGFGPVVAYDAGPGFAAARAWWCLRYFGHDDVRVLDGGLAAWRAAELPVESGVAVPPPGDFVADPGHCSVLDAEEAAACAREGLLLDARLEIRYRGDSLLDPVRGHIPGAVSAPTFDNVRPDGTFLPPRSLRRRFAGLGAAGDPETGIKPPPVGVYCGSGVTAAHEALAITVAGLETPAVYVGSWSEWFTDPSRPIQLGPDPG
jgi:thiosulfate/3-mercaptopyruvate sulfurtransferase